MFWQQNYEVASTLGDQTQIFYNTYIYPLIRTRKYEYQGIRNVSF